MKLLRLVNSKKGRAFAASLPVLALTAWQCWLAYRDPNGCIVEDAGSLACGALFSAVLAVLGITLSLRFMRMSWRRFIFGDSASVMADIKAGVKHGTLALFAVVGFAVVQSLLLEALGVECTQQQIIEMLNSQRSTTGLKVLLALDGVLLAPVIEEMLFRGVLLRCWSDMSRHFAWPLIFSALYFSLMHLHAPSFLPLAFLALCLGLAWREKRSLIAPMVMHALFNAFSLVMYIAGIVLGIE